MKRLLSAITLGATMMSAAAFTLEVTPGTLADRLPANISDRTLTLTGNADARDIAILSNLPQGITTLDMSQLKIMELRSQKPILDGRTFFSENEIPEYAFFKSALTTVKLPAGVTSVANGAFAHSDIVSVTIPAGVTEIGDYAFYGCDNLTTVTVPATVSTLGTGAFGNCNRLKSIDLSSSAVTAIPDRMLAGCTNLSTIKLGSRISAIGSEAFDGTAIASLDLSNVTTLADYALAGMSQLTSVSLNDNATLGQGVLMDNVSLENVSGNPATLPNLFAANCRLLIPGSLIEGAETIGNFAFANLQTDSLMFGYGLQKVGAGSFAGVTNLNYIDARALEAGTPEVEDNAFDGINTSEVTLYVATYTEDVWMDHPVWGRFKVRSDNYTDVGTTPVANSIEIFMRAGNLIVEAPETLTAVTLHSADGTLLGSWTPDASSARIAADNLPSGVIVVGAATANARRSVKLLTR